LEAAVGWALLKASGLEIERRKLAQLCQRAENEYTGTRCGIMDQLASCCCVKGQALLLDCRSLDFRTFPLPEHVRLVICNTMVQRELSNSAYNTRRSECEEGVRIIAAKYPGVRALRDVSSVELESCRKDLPEIVYRRCRHVVTENGRVLKAAAALEQKRFDELRQAMAESHRSLREDYEVSCRELDLLVELAGQSEGVYGARMTGAGFGGCTINLVHSGSVEAFAKRIWAEYERRTGLKPDIYVCDAADGVGSAS
jgi:galactokinase